MGEDTVDYYVTGWGLLAVATFGITGNKTLESSQFSGLRSQYLGNILSIILLRRKSSRLNPTFSNLISWSAIFDSIFLVRKFRSLGQ